MFQYPYLKGAAAFGRGRVRFSLLLIMMMALAAWAHTCQGANGQGSAIKQASKLMIGELEFKDATIQDAVRVISELTGVNIVATTEAGKSQVTVFVRNLSVADTVDSICRIAGLWYRYNAETGIFIIMTTAEYQRDIVVFRYEPTRMFKLKYLNVSIAARTISDLFGDRVRLKGEAEWQKGDDYEFDQILSDADIKEESDESDAGGEDEDDEVRFSSGKKNGSQSGTTLSATQIGRLENMSRQDAMAVSEGIVRQVAQQKESAIYVTVNRLHNMLFVRTADEKAMKEIARIIKDSDQQVPEVLLEMKVLQVELTDQFESAFDLSQISGSQQSGPDDGLAVNPLNTTAGSVGRTLLGMGNSSLIEDSTMVFQVLSGNLRMRLQLLQDNDNVKALATPMLLAANNHPAKLFIGEETIITTGFKSTQVTDASSSGEGTTVTTYVPVPETEVREIGNTLTILPSINADRSVVMRIVHENSTVNTNGGKIPLLVGSDIQNVAIDTVDTSKLEGTFLAQDGMTVAVGGMMRTTYTDNESKVPILGDIPGLGFFFKNQQKIEKKYELVLLITPHVLSAPDQGEEISRRRLNALTGSKDILGVFPENRVAAAPVVQPEAVQGLFPAQSPSPLDGPRDADEDRRRFIEMTSVAVKQLRMPFDLRRPKENIRPVHLASLGPVQVFAYRGISSEPLAAWTDGQHYATALKVTNNTRETQHLNVADLCRPWTAATLEKQELAPRGKAGDFTYLYLISQRPFDQEIRLKADNK